MPDHEKLLERVIMVEAEQKAMKEKLDKISDAQDKLLALANQGKGSLRTFLWIGGLVAGIVGLAGSVAGFHIGIRELGG